MNMDEVIKYLAWVVFFSLVLAGIYLTLKRLGMT